MQTEYIPNETAPAPSLLSPTDLSSLRNSILHDAGHVGDGKIDVLLPEVLFDAAVVMVTEILLSVIYRTRNAQIESAVCDQSYKTHGHVMAVSFSCSSPS